MVYEEMKKFSIPISLQDFKKNIMNINISKEDINKLRSNNGQEKRDVAKKLMKEFGRAWMRYTIADYKSVLIGATVNMEYKSRERYQEWCKVVGPLHELLENA